MKKIITLSLLLGLGLAACKKTSVAPANQSNSLAAQSTVTSQKSNAAYLIAHTWQYNKYYFTDVNGQHLLYQRSDSNNLANLNSDTLKFFANGTFTQGNKHKSTHGTWQFTDSTQKVLSVKGHSAAALLNIDLLDKNHWNWTNNTSGTTHYDAEMVPKPGT